MTTGQDELVPFYCPRCGGLMQKPDGSAFYWHASPNHPRCTITNLEDRSGTTTSPSAASARKGSTEDSKTYL